MIRNEHAIASLIVVLIALLLLPAIALAGGELPVENGVVTSGVGVRLDPFGSGRLVFHRGIDIAVPVGTPVHAVRKGRVVFAGARRGYGMTVIVEHDNGDRTLYGHNSLVRVKAGEVVAEGTVVAFSGNTGRSTGPHVHFEQMPSGRPLVETAEPADSPQSQRIAAADRRDLLEQQLDESLNSVIKTITGSGRGG